MAFPTLMTLAMADVDPSLAGLASGLVNTTAQVGGALGLAVLATLATSRTENLLADGRLAVVALTSGYQLAFLIGAVLIAVGVAIAVTVMRDPAGAMAHEGEQGSPKGAEAAYEEAA